ncbi:lipase maturation factor [Plakobranchus ocellatus]|uniref:Lipase maturation factor 2 n=1 Tax=Plakobranchus ocellatus TaxID=259542 RepID=A0AAV4ASB1_9GAST|nr:lipase maturation factor [Plakobranchus ocellatus]
MVTASHHRCPTLFYTSQVRLLCRTKSSNSTPILGLSTSPAPTGSSGGPAMVSVPSCANYCLFLPSRVPHSYLDNKAFQNLPKYAKTWHGKLEPFEITNSYSLFRTMTGVGGRPEIIVEGHPSDRAAADGWRTYEFLYKPGNVSDMPAVVAPHQPRLDWQMWFAALGNYQNNPWFLHLVYRLLQGEPDVLELLSQRNPPFPAHGSPPMYIRATLYHYHFTNQKDCAGSKKKCNWWKREKKAEYLPALALTDKSFVDYLKQAKLITNEKSKPFRADNWLAKFVMWSRDTIGQPEGFNFTFSMFCSAILAMFLNRAIF